MLRPEQNTGLRLQQRMAPQLIQSLRLLQMSTLDLTLEVKQQLELNPLLEEVVELREEGEEEEELREQEEGLKAEEDLPADMEEVDWDALLDDQFDAGAYNSERTEYDPNWEADREPQENRITAMPPLLEHLYRQLGEISGLAPEERAIAEYIIGNIDERGYVGCSLAEIAEDLQVEVAAVEKVLRVIQTFDPSGVGARDLRECLMIQLSQRADPLSALALQVVRDHLEDLTRRRLQHITRALAISNEKLKEVLQVIERLQPHPGLLASSDYNNLLTLDSEVAYITPDLVVEKIGEEWQVWLADGSMPSLKHNSENHHLLHNTHGHRAAAVKDYVAKNLNDARWLINAIHQRRTTILKVGNYLLQAQLPFFEQGPSRLRPLVLQDVADAVGMHVSTISRVSNGKYVQTPHGVFELKYFFDNKLITDEGEDVSVRSVKEKISQLVADEDKARPLSDQQIVEELSKGRLKIARRTIAKYRDQLKIPSQRYRREL
ncbi:MAG: RNA polymerase factor sigma-54 [Gemmatimonadetes bacterium]|nr:RNA polymerase factor sigma-54 [Gemmatimonadota bacterium]